MKVKMEKCGQDYIVNRKTMAILPLVTKDNQIISKIIEEEEEILVFKKPIEIIEQSCLFYGSSFYGRKEGTKELIDVTHKAPICISPADNLYFFSTLSYTREECAWLSHSHVVRSKDLPHNNLLIKFSNDKTIKLAISQNSFNNQRNRTAQLRSAFEGLKERKTVQTFEFIRSHEIFEHAAAQDVYAAKWDE
ncbi:competence protein ComK [Ectobacillus panaciterrae]|uniref:competence protein ComK n=1 Tax=Ectobacillus panaciterrae TaxID=363872 RepID=UPI0003FCF774|nr:competence protein ComK [Ectobacillus panaciterrae]